MMPEIWSSRRRRRARSPKVDVGVLGEQIALALEAAAPDLKSRGLARWYADAVLQRLLPVAPTLTAVERDGYALFYWIGRDVLGPIATLFVDAAMKGFGGHLVFPRRDADPLCVVAVTLNHLQPTRYRARREQLHNPVLTRGMLGITDEQSEAGASRLDPAVLDRLLRSIGFGSGQPVRLVDIGSWGTIVDALKRGGPTTSCRSGSSFPTYQIVSTAT